MLPCCCLLVLVFYSRCPLKVTLISLHDCQVGTVENLMRVNYHSQFLLLSCPTNEMKKTKQKNREKQLRRCDFDLQIKPGCTYVVRKTLSTMKVSLFRPVQVFSAHVITLECVAALLLDTCARLCCVFLFLPPSKDCAFLQFERRREQKRKRTSYRILSCAACFESILITCWQFVFTRLSPTFLATPYY